MKPRLTKLAIERLRAVENFARCEAEPALDGTDDQIEFAEKVIAGCDWLEKLFRWYDERTPDEEQGNYVHGSS